jgi:hypothetical protein
MDAKYSNMYTEIWRKKKEYWEEKELTKKEQGF